MGTRNKDRFTIRDWREACPTVARIRQARWEVLAVCRVCDIDIGAWLVLQGLALDYPRYSRRAYFRQQAQAQAASRGVWAGEFQRPWEWRARP